VTAIADRVLHGARTAGRPYAVRDGLVVAWQGDRGFYTNGAILTSVPADWDATLGHVADVVPRLAPALLISPFSTPDLSGRGWQLVGHPPLMVRLPGEAAAPSLPAALHIDEVVDQPGLEVFERTLVDGYPSPEQQPYEWGGFLHERVLGGASRFWVGFVAGRPVATAASHTAAGVNNVEFVATVAGERGRGYGAAVTWAATTADPSLPAVLIASDLGRPVYERLGYVLLTRWTLWLRPPVPDR
jgi:hypothetical protein